MDKATEQNHATEIRSIGELAGMSAEQVARMVERNLSPDEARREAFEHLKKRNGPPIRTAHLPQVGATGYDDSVFLRNAMADALYVRVNHSHEPGEAARPYINRRVADLAREILLARGFETIGWSDTTVIDRALYSTSDFPLLLGDVANKVLREMLAAAPAAIKAICRQATIPDFRNRYSLQLG